MRFPTELRIFVDRPKPRTFYEYIADQIINGRDINFKQKEAFDMRELLEEKKSQLQAQLNNSVSHEEEIAKIVAEYEQEVRKEFATRDTNEKAKLVAQIEVVEELIKEQENLSADIETSEVDETEEAKETEQTEDCDATNEN